MESLSTFVSALTSPKETFALKKKEASFRKGLELVAVVSVFTAISGTLGILLMPDSSQAKFWAPLFTGAQGFSGVAYFVFSFLLGVIGSLVFVWVVNAISRQLGGKGTYTELLFLSLLYGVPIAIASPLLQLIPLVGGALSLVLGLYGFYLWFLTMKETHGFSFGRSCLVFLVLLAIFAVIGIIAGFVAVLSAIGARAAAH